jgi:1-acyl-sn-glycerol-3-phosphate acyltransferase
MWLYHLNVTAGSLLRPYWRLGLEGHVDLIPRQGPLIVAANHSSFLDPWFIALVFPRPLRYLITHRWFYRSGTWTRLFRAWGTIPVKERDPRGTLSQLGDRLAAGEAIGMFPEGKISCDGRIQKLQTGVARVAAGSGAPVLPVGICGGFESLPRQRRFPRPSRVRVVAGEPMRFSQAPCERPDAEHIAAFNRELLGQLVTLSGKPPRDPELLPAWV